jgi:uncharacterized protein YutE (UPF0331/DUF86 family)
LVDAERAAARLERVRDLLTRLERVRSEGKDAYLASPEVRAMTERWLELSVQICIDLGTQLVMETSTKAPETYAGVFEGMREAGILPSDLAAEMVAAAKQRNLLVHLYMEIDDEMVFESLDHLEAVRRFAVVVGERID